MPTECQVSWLQAGVAVVLLVFTAVVVTYTLCQHRGPCNYVIDCCSPSRLAYTPAAAAGFHDLQSNFPTYVINLDRSKERWVEAERRIRAAGFRNVIRHSGVDALEPGALARGWKRHGSPAFHAQDDLFTTRKLGKQGCFLSHMDVLRRIIDDQTPLAVVFEDDISFHPDFATLAPRFYDLLTPKDFELLFLGAQVLAEYPIPDDNLVARGVPVQCTHAYIVTLEGAKKLYDSLVGSEARDRGVYTIDLMMRDVMKSGRAPFVWYVWHGRKFPVRNSVGALVSASHKNAGLVFQDDDFVSLVEADTR